MNDHLFSHSQRQQHTPLFALKRRIKVCPHCAARFLAHTGGYCHKANYAPFYSLLWRSTLLLCVRAEGVKERQIFRGMWGV